MTRDAKKALYIGSICAFSYLAVMIARNILAAVSPQMIASGTYTTERIGTLSSVFFVTYAVGQLINGIIGDNIKAKYMVGVGLAFAGLNSFLFYRFSASHLFSVFAYGAVGFFLSMIHSPITKVVADNTNPIYTPRCALGYSFSSLLGSPIAGLLAAGFVWFNVFKITSLILVVTGVFCFIIYSLFEKKGYIIYKRQKQHKAKTKNIKLLIERKIITFSFVSALTGIVRTTVVFWLSTYCCQYLGFSSEIAAVIFTVSTFAISLAPFIAIFVYEHLNRDVYVTIFLAFTASAICFIIVYLIRFPFLNIISMVLAITFASCASCMLWNQYCPSLKDTGMVSGATGYLDFISYIAASLSSKLFSNAVSTIGWGNLILVWFGLMIIGMIIILPCYVRSRPFHISGSI